MTISSTPTASEINLELGRAADAPFSIDGAEERALAQVPSGPISFSDFIGKSAVYSPLFVSNNASAWIECTTSVSRDVSKWIMSVWIQLGDFIGGSAPIFMQRSGSVIHGFQPFDNQGYSSYHGGVSEGSTRASTPDNVWAQDILHHILVCYDSSRAPADRIRMYLDDLLLATPSLSFVPTTYSNPVAFLRDPAFPSVDMNALALSELYVNYGESLDLDVEANRRKFITAEGEPVDLGADGSEPTGNQPDFYFGRFMTPADWNNGVNLGSDTSPRTVNGTFIDAVVPPQDDFVYTMTAGAGGSIIGFSTYDFIVGSIAPAQFEGIDVTRVCDTISLDGYVRFSLGSTNLPVDFCTKVEIEGITDPNWSGGRRVFYPALNDLFVPSEVGSTAWFWTFGTRFVNGHQYRVQLSNNPNP